VRSEIASEVDRLFRLKTGVHRRLHPTSPADLKLRRIWLRIRDEVVSKKEQALDDAWYAPGGAADQIEADRMDTLLTAIPYEMRFFGWNEGAELLDTWFERPPLIAPAYTAPVTDVITMDWVLGFDRARTVFDAIVRERIWTNTASQERLTRVLRSAPPVGQTFGDLSRPAAELDAAWVNSRPVTSGTIVDGLTAALGSFHLQVAVAGKSSRPSSNVITLVIDEVGIYVKDSFDFNGTQFLGVWGYRDQGVGNDDFRRWRAEHHLGGDFMVFSDVRRIRVTPPNIVTVTL
jgi:hypothetical protein